MIRDCTKDWGMTNTDANDHLGGTLTTWSPALKMISAKQNRLVLGTKLEDSETEKRFTILNLYGPFYDRREFLETVEESGELDAPDVIIGRDFNLTLTTNEIWGKNARGDSIGTFFSHLFEQKGLIDMAQQK